MKLYDHQKATVDFGKANDKIMNTSSPGTGKTISTLSTWYQRADGKLFVVCPKTIMDAAWGRDIANHFGDKNHEVLDRTMTRKSTSYIAGLLNNNDIVICNPEAVPLFMNADAQLRDNYSTFVLDEFTSIKNRSAQRSKNVQKFASKFKYMTLLSGTPTPNTILDIWHPMYVLDQGQRLGHDFYNFRSAVCQPITTQAGMRQFVNWVDIPGSTEAVAEMIRDINIRFKLEDVVDMPERLFNTMELPMPTKLKTQYDAMEATAVLELHKEESITAVNRAVLGNKLLQLASGSIYGDDQRGHVIDTAKYDLIVELVEERQQSLVFYQWQHQCDVLHSLLDKAGLSHAIINGKTSQAQRGEIVKRFQNGDYRTLLIQPAAAAHGLTLTNSTASIWISPTFNLEHFEQANHRDYRIGQTKTTEVIMLQYADTIEPYVYQKLMGKQESLRNLLHILQEK